MERSAFFATAWRLGRYYRTYPEYVEDEVRGALRDPTDFARGRACCRSVAPSPTTDPRSVVEDGRLRLGAVARRRVPVREAIRGPTRKLTQRRPADRGRPLLVVHLGAQGPDGALVLRTVRERVVLVDAHRVLVRDLRDLVVGDAVELLCERLG